MIEQPIMDAANRAARNGRRAQRALTGTAKSSGNVHYLPLPAPAADDDWESLRMAERGMRRHFLTGAPLVDYFRNDPAAKAFDLLRSRILHTMRANGLRRIAVAAPTAGCGTTFTAVNLALSMARVPSSRTVLIDMNHANPGVAKMLELDETGDLDGFLTGGVTARNYFLRTCGNLAVGLAGAVTPDRSERLMDRKPARALALMERSLRPDTVVFDMPPVLESDAFAAFLPQVDGVLLVSDGTRTQAGQINACKDMIGQQSNLLGVVLNRAQGGAASNRAD